jgi:hypothetical protein
VQGRMLDLGVVCEFRPDIVISGRSRHRSSSRNIKTYIMAAEDHDQGPVNGTLNTHKDATNVMLGEKRPVGYNFGSRGFAPGTR